MNAINPWQRGHACSCAAWPRATLAAKSAPALPDVIAACKVAGFDLVVVETSGIGQGDAAIVPHVDVPMYVMTPEFGAASQLEKIDMLDFAEFVAINKFDRKGAPTRCAMWPSRCSATRKPGASGPTTCRCLAPWPHASMTTASPRCTRPSSPAAGAGLTLQRRHPAPGAACATAPTRPRWCRPRAPATWPKSATPCAATSSAPAQARWPAKPAAARIHAHAQAGAPHKDNAVKALDDLAERA
jgi:hypothetical protein